MRPMRPVRPDAQGANHFFCRWGFGLLLNTLPILNAYYHEPWVLGYFPMPLPILNAHHVQNDLLLQWIIWICPAYLVEVRMHKLRLVHLSKVINVVSSRVTELSFQVTELPFRLTDLSFRSN